MRKVGTALVAGLGLCAAMVAGASAADIRPSYKAPPPPPPQWSWTGFYIGIQGGAGWGPSEWTQNVNLGAIGIGIIPPLNTTGSLTTSGPFFGGVVGFNWQVNWAVFGVEADGNWADIKGTSNCGLAALWNCHTKTESFGTITGRLGAAVDRALIYVKAGGAWVNNKYDLNVLGLTLPGALIGIPGTIVQPSSVDDSRWGWVIGTGLEYAFLGNWSAKIEYNYMDFGDKDHRFNSVPATAQIAGGAGLLDNFSIDDRLHVVKFGVNYRWGGWGGGPGY